MDRVLDIDETSHSARIEAGALGPRLEEQLKARGLTLRHFPQSFEFSTLGGWLATRAGGHFATVETHIDDLTESIRAVTPSGVIDSWRLPGSGAGPSPDRLLLGSEGTLGVITEAWMRVRPRPAIEEICGAPPILNCRLTHVYADGAAPYFTVIAPGRRGDELRMWDEIKVAAGELLAAHGASITHHHAVGRDHRPWYDRQRPEPFAAALRAVKRELDPGGILNPGALIG